MITTTADTTMEQVHELATQEFGRFARSLQNDGTMQPLDIPGGRYAVVLRLSSPQTLTASKVVALSVDFERPGLADFLLREHAALMFGRFERVGERGLAVEHSVFSQAISGPQLTRVVLAVHQAAINAYQTLAAVGVIDEDEETDDSNQG